MTRIAPAMWLSVLLFLAVGCSQRAPVPTASPKADGGMSRDTLWQRRQECAAAVDRAVKRTGWDKGEQSGYKLTQVSNYYNSAEDRCFIRVDAVNITQAISDVNVPIERYYVYDAFEPNPQRVYCTDTKGVEVKPSCGVTLPGKDTVYDCAQCRAVAKDLMTK